jgi:hypothetical protein
MVQKQAAGVGFPTDYQTIAEAEQVYSRERSQDIASEYRFQYPGLGSIFESFRGKQYTFEREALEWHCLALATGEIRLETEAKWVLDQAPDVIIDALWQVGFLKAHAVGGLKARRRSGSSYLGAYQVQGLNLVAINRFQVHQMFRAHLGMKEVKRSTSISGEERDTPEDA